MAWEKRVKAQRVQSTVISSITEAKEFDKIKISKNAHKDSQRRSKQAKAHKTDMLILHSSHPQDNAWYMEKHAWNAVKLATSEQYAEPGGPEP